MSTERQFPVLESMHRILPKLPISVPWSVMREDRALKNHSQTLERLAQRGGLSWSELECIINDRAWDGTIFILPRQEPEMIAFEAAAAVRVLRLISKKDSKP